MPVRWLPPPGFTPPSRMCAHQCRSREWGPPAECVERCSERLPCGLVLRGAGGCLPDGCRRAWLPDCLANRLSDCLAPPTLAQPIHATRAAGCGSVASNSATGQHDNAPNIPLVNINVAALHFVPLDNPLLGGISLQERRVQLAQQNSTAQHSTQCTAHNAQHIVHSTQCTSHTAHHTVHSTHSTPHNAQHIVHSTHSTPHTAHHTVHSTHSTPHGAHHTVHSTQCTAHSAQHTQHITPQPARHSTAQHTITQRSTSQHKEHSTTQHT
jgi:hypothetical protein